MKIDFYSKEIIEVAKKNMFLSSPLWHKLFNPYCGICMAEKGRKIIRKMENENGGKS